MRSSKKRGRPERLWKGKNSEKQHPRVDYELLAPLLSCESDLILFQNRIKNAKNIRS